MNDFTLKNLIKKPSVITDNPPGIFLLHGYGSNMHDLFSFADLLPEEAFVIAFNAHQNTPFGGSAWYSLNFESKGLRFDFNEIIEAKQLIEDNIRFAIEKFNLNRTNNIIIGFSQGAILSYTLGCDNTDIINTIVAFSGYLIDEYKSPEKMKNFNHINLFVSHGKYDDVIPIIMARNTNLTFKNSNIKIFYKEYDMAHSITQECLNDSINFIKQF